jgi:hypothetical protein
MTDFLFAASRPAKSQFSRGWRECSGAGDFDEDGVAITLAALGEPGGKTFGKTFGREAKAGFDGSVGDRKGVIELGGIRKIAHAKLVKPFQRAGATLAANGDVHVKFLSVHGGSLSLRRP